MREVTKLIEKDIKEIIPQIPGESDASYCRLILMLKKGLGTLQELHDYMEKENHKYYVTLDTLLHNSSKDNWTQRRKKYYNIRDQELREEVEELFQELNVIGIHDMQQYMGDINKLKKDIMQQYHEGVYKASYVLKILKDYIFCYRQATEIYYINSRHPLIPDTTNTNTNRTDEKLEQVSKVLYGEDDDK